MTDERDVIIEGISYCVVVSDEQEALLAAKAAGRAFVGVWQGDSHWQEDSPDWLWKADYVVDSAEAADDRLLERVVRRKRGLPWIIAESERIRIREFRTEDAPQVAAGELTGDMEAVFSEPDRLKAYIDSQYGFYEYGIWAVVRRSDERIIGMAGVSDCDIQRWEQTHAEMQLELGYHIFRPYRRQGFAKEACRLILDYIKREYGCPVYASVEAENTASVRLLEKLGFCPCHHVKPGAESVTARKCNGSEIRPYLYVRCWQ